MKGRTRRKQRKEATEQNGRKDEYLDKPGGRLFRVGMTAVITVDRKEGGRGGRKGKEGGK